MNEQLKVVLTDEETQIELNNQEARIRIIEMSKKKKVAEKKPSVYVGFKKENPIYVSQIEEEKLVDKMIVITPSSWDIELDYLEQFIADELIEQGIMLQHSSKRKIPASSDATIRGFYDRIQKILSRFGVSLMYKEEKPTKAKPAKATHRWSKDVSKIEFFIDSRESKATVMWQKRNEMLIKKGATMMHVPPLNKDGSLGFSAKFGEKIRADHVDKIKHFKTTADIILKSVNEVGLFLYFGGTNSWLEIKDADGKTIDEWTVVK